MSSQMISPNAAKAALRLRELFCQFVQQGCVSTMKPDLSLSAVSDLSPRKGSPPSLALRVLIAARAKARRSFPLAGDVAPSPAEGSLKQDLPLSTGGRSTPARPN
jgi:hypothetical protein